MARDQVSKNLLGRIKVIDSSFAATALCVVS